MCVGLERVRSCPLISEVGERGNELESAFHRLAWLGYMNIVTAIQAAATEINA